MNKGVIEQIGSPENIYEHPANKFVYQFLGDVNVFKGTIDKGKFDFSGSYLHTPKHLSVINSDATGYIRPDEIEITKQYSENLIPAKVAAIRSAGSIIRVELRRDDDGETVLAEIRKNHFKKIGISLYDQVFLNIADMKVFLNEGADI
jgi:sulfate transport system ATP-binding protein